jgi:hypothetical protein
MQRFICSITDKNGSGKDDVRIGRYDDDEGGYAAAEEWARREDKPGCAVYDAVNLYKDGAQRRNLNTVAALTCLHADVDLKDIVEGREDVVKRIRALPLPPSKVIDSGHGVHVYYVFREPIPVEDPEAETARELRTQLTEHLAADRQVDQDAALMRRPGTTNSKFLDKPVSCAILWEEANRLYDVSDFDELAESFSGPPILRRKAKAGKNGDADEGEEYAGPVDVSAELAELEPGGVTAGS